MKKQAIPAPGTVLKESFLDKYQISVARLSEDIILSPSAIRQIINNKLRIGIVVAMKLAAYFGTTVKYWIDMQHNYEISRLEEDKELSDILKNIPKAQMAAPKPVKKAAQKKAADKADKKSASKKGTAKAAKAQDDKKTAARKPRKPAL
jgi:addiction module HigA family antidote